VSVFDNAHLCSIAGDIAKDGGSEMHATVTDALVFFAARYLFLSYCPPEE